MPERTLRIVGLGPGDPGLLTLGSLESLRAAGQAVTLLAPPELTLFLEAEGVLLLRNGIAEPNLLLHGNAEAAERFVTDLFEGAADGNSRREIALGVLGNPLSDFAGLPVLLRTLEARGIEAELVPGVPRATLSAAVAVPLLPLPPQAKHHSWSELVEIMARLRRSCPWDREQTHRSLVSYLIEETYELVEAIESDHDADLCGELGDLLLQILFHAQLATERGRFSIADVIDALANKMIHRHPHVFGETHVADLSELWKNWETLKSVEEAAQRRPSRLDGVPPGLGALQRSQKLQVKAARVGFDWVDIEDIFLKLDEEFAELREALHEREQRRADEESTPKRETPHPLADPDRHLREEIGDCLFTLVNLARRLDIDAEGALRTASEKFQRRFTFIERLLHEQGRELAKLQPDEHLRLWQLAKRQPFELAASGTNAGEKTGAS